MAIIIIRFDHQPLFREMSSYRLKNLRKFTILDRKPQSQVRILIYRTWAIVNAPDIKCNNYPMAVYVCHKKTVPGPFMYDQ